MLAVERQLGVKRQFDDTTEMRQAAEKKVVKLEAKIERSSRDSQRSDLERGFASPLASSRNVKAVIIAAEAATLPIGCNTSLGAR